MIDPCPICGRPQGFYEGECDAGPRYRNLVTRTDCERAGRLRAEELAAHLRDALDDAIPYLLQPTTRVEDGARHRELAERARAARALVPREWCAARDVPQERDEAGGRLRQVEAGLEGHGVGMLALDLALSPRDGEGLIEAALPVEPDAPDHDEALRRLAGAARDVPQEWEP